MFPSKENSGHNPQASGVNTMTLRVSENAKQCSPPVPCGVHRSQYSSSICRMCGGNRVACGLRLFMVPQRGHIHSSFYIKEHMNGGTCQMKEWSTEQHGSQAIGADSLHGAECDVKGTGLNGQWPSAFFMVKR